MVRVCGSERWWRQIWMVVVVRGCGGKRGCVAGKWW